MKKSNFKTIGLGFLLLATLTFSSCKKSSSNPSSSNYYVKFKLNGSDKEYSKTTTAVFTTQLPLYSLIMVGEQQNGTVYEGMGINIFNNTAITANVTYTGETVISGGSSTDQASLLYTDATGTQFSSSFGSTDDAKVTITQLDDKTVSGTFSGTITNTTDLTTTETVTDGTFYLPRQ